MSLTTNQLLIFLLLGERETQWIINFLQICIYKIRDILTGLIIHVDSLRQKLVIELS